VALRANVFLEALLRFDDEGYRPKRMPPVVPIPLEAPYW
jgi:hypothetical protein